MKVVLVVKFYSMRFLGVALSLLCSMAFWNTVTAQRNCGTVEYNQMLQQQNPGRETQEQFEKWMKEGLRNQAFSQSFFALKETNILTIPVVVHIIHNGEAVGVGSNISDAQIQSQIDVLNEDFRRLNADTTDTRSEFLPAASDPGIEFVLALSDPEGLPTTGILRVQGVKTSWTSSDDVLLKSQSYWDAEDYFNIWVAPLSGGLLGYAQFPVSDLDGLEGSSNNRLTDGIVVGYNFFGSIDKDPSANVHPVFRLGRTATHEVGHFLGLRHIWGDSPENCVTDDFVTDTPPQATDSGGLPSCPLTKDSCTSDSFPDMIENYMDYTNDVCMNIFTEGQKDRMRYVLDNSPRRASLLTSPGLQPPNPAAIDVGIKEIINPTDIICETTFIPVMRIRNYGTDDVTSIVSELRVNGVVEQTKTVNVTLQSLDTFDIAFDSQPSPPAPSANIEFRIVSVNGGPDEVPSNDSETVQVTVAEFIAIPFLEDFEDFDGWEIENPDSLGTWELGENVSWEAGNTSMQLSYHTDLAVGQEDRLVLPAIDLSAATTAYLTFDYAYAYHNAASIEDRMDVLVSLDCGETFGNALFSRTGVNLGTTESTSLNFIPSNRTDWKREVLPLTSLVGESSVILAFVGTNGSGNNIYVDNVGVSTADVTDVGIKGIKSPRLAFCNSTPTPIITIENLGSEIINDIQVDYLLSGSSTQSKSFTGLSLLKGNSTDLTLDPVDVALGTSTFTVQVDLVGQQDPTTSNNALSIEFNQECTEESIPLRQQFEEDEITDAGWTAMNQFNQAGWQLFDTPVNQSSARLDNFNATLPGIRNYLITPILDLTLENKASVFFDVSYATDTIPGEWLRVLLSEDNGLNYDQVLLERSSMDLSVSPTSTAWVPQIEGDWRTEFIDLTSFVGKKIKLAFETSDHNSNMLYIDNVEFFVDDNPTPVRPEMEVLPYPNPATNGQFNLTFNLPEKEEVTVIILDTMGKEVFRRSYPETLNQTYPFDMAGNGSGLYLLKVLSPSIDTTSRIFINR